ncbi:unnamed protein product [Schistosoma intercalatum]|nr:unnamed protein product [Schistosoma intercalatum]
MEEMIFQRLQNQVKSGNVTSLISSNLFIQRIDNFYKLTFNVSKRIFKEINICLDSKILRLISTCQLILMHLIMVNWPLGSVRVYRLTDSSEAPRCECKPNSEDPCGPSSNCINRELHYECLPSICPNGDACRNQRFTKRLYPPQRPFWTGDQRGWGLKTMTATRFFRAIMFLEICEHGRVQSNGGIRLFFTQVTFFKLDLYPTSQRRCRDS